MDPPPSAVKRREDVDPPPSPRLTKAKKTGQAGDSAKERLFTSKKGNGGDGPGSSDPDDDAPIKPGRIRHVPQPETSDGHAADTELAAMVELLLQSTDPGLVNAKRIGQHMQGVTLNRDLHTELQISIKKQDFKGRDTFMRDKLEGTPIFGRDVRPDGYTKSTAKGCWLFKVVDRSSKSVRMFNTKDLKGTIKINFTTLPETASASVLERIAPQLAQYFNAWPWTARRGMPLPTELWMSMILTDIDSRLPEIHDVEINGRDYYVKVHHIDPVTGAFSSRPIYILPTDNNLQNVQPPPMPALIMRYTSPNTPTKLTNEYIGKPPKLDKSLTSPASLHKAQDILRWIAFQLQGIIASSDRVDQLVKRYKQDFGFHEGLTGGEYRSKTNLYVFSRHGLKRSMTVRPSQAVMRIFGDVTLTQARLAMTIHSLYASRCTPVFETIIQLFYSGWDMRIVWIEAAKTADQVNIAITEGLSPSSQCDCSDEQAKKEHHACEGCGKPVLCCDRKLDSHKRLVCERCSKRDTSHYVYTRIPGESQIQHIVSDSITRSFHRECEVRGFNPDTPANEKILQAAIKDAKAQLIEDKTEYIDKYTGSRHDMSIEQSLLGNNPSRRRYLPWGVCVDAAFPEGSPEHQSLKHSPGNLVVTSNVCNMAKYIHLPGALHLVAEYLRINNPTSDDKLHLQQSLMALTVARLKRRFVVRVVSISNQTQYEASMNEMVSGKVDPNHPGPWDAHSQRYVVTTPMPFKGAITTNLWTSSVWDRLQDCIMSIADYFGVKDQLYKLADGALWFGDDRSGTCPVGFDRNSIFQLCHERLDRMRLVCNKKWVTGDNTETLYMEIMFQFCASLTIKPNLQLLKNKYGDRLRLPMNVFINSPLKFSIAHREHGFGMSTGWPTLHPVNVNQRISNDHKNNMLIETWFVNSAKMDMAEEYYEKLDDILRKVSVSKEYYNPDLYLMPDASQRTLGFDDVPEDYLQQDDLDAAGFNDDAFDNHEGRAATGHPSTSGPSTAGPSTAGPSNVGLPTAGPSTVGPSFAGPSRSVLRQQFPSDDDDMDYDSGVGIRYEETLQEGEGETVMLEEQEVQGEGSGKEEQGIQQAPEPRSDVDLFDNEPDALIGTVRNLRHAIMDCEAAAIIFCWEPGLTSFLSDAHMHAVNGDYAAFMGAIRGAENFLRDVLVTQGGGLHPWLYQQANI